MYSFLLEAAPKGEEAYDWFVYKKGPTIALDFRGSPREITKGTKFGVRPSSNGKFVRLVFPGDVNRVITVPYEVAQKLAKGVK
jgi:hypothetical protein